MLHATSESRLALGRDKLKPSPSSPSWLHAHKAAVLRTRNPLRCATQQEDARFEAEKVTSWSAEIWVSTTENLQDLHLLKTFVEPTKNYGNVSSNYPWWCPCKLSGKGSKHPFSLSTVFLTLISELLTSLKDRREGIILLKDPPKAAAAVSAPPTHLPS